MGKRWADPERDELLTAVVEHAFRDHAAQLYRYVYSKVGQAALAEDLTSEVFLKALRWLQQERSPQSVRGWLYATARTTISDDWQRRQRLAAGGRSVIVLTLPTLVDDPSPLPAGMIRATPGGRCPYT